MIKSYKNIDDVVVAGKTSGCSDFVRSYINKLNKGEFILIADLTSEWAEKANKTKKACGPQIRQTAERIGRLDNIQTGGGKRSIVYKK